MPITLLDIAPVAEKVTIQGKEFEVSGVSAETLASLLAQLPELRMLIGGKEMDESMQQALMVAAPHVLGAILCAAMGADWRNEDEVAAACKLSAGDQFAVLETAIRLTFPQGVANFMEGLQRLEKAAGGPIKEAVTKSPAPSQG